MVLSRRSINRLDGVKAILIAIVVEAIKEAPYDFGIAWMGGRRTAKEQHQLFESMKSKADGYTKLSKHQKGLAFDIVCYENGNITWSKFVFKSVADHIKKIAKEKYNINIKWGGDWVTFQDMPHFQISKNE